ncbi:MAG TPA: acyl-CoA dehydrogenase [Polyangiales bacterium]
MANPLLNDRDVSFLLFELFEAEALCALPAFAEHSRETFSMYVDACRKLAREALYPSYRPMDEATPRLVDGRLFIHPRMRELHPKLVELGVINATRPAEVGGQQLPQMVAACAHAYLVAANLSAYGYAGLAAGTGRLIESFGTEEQKRDYMARLYDGSWTGTMALTEPHAGSSLADVATRATPVGDGSYRIQGSKIFISGGDHDLTENIVHMTLARIDGAPAGVKGISLFIVPQKRIEGGKLVHNDTAVAGMIHKIGWRGLPSIALNYGENGDCRGYLLGEPNHGLSYMFQMMNEARMLVGLNGVATAYVAYQESLEYAKTRPQGRLPANKGSGAQVPIIAHADVRRMLLRQKAIVEGGLALIVYASRCADLAEHATNAAQKKENALLLDLLTPVAKSFPAEKGFESNALAMQIHGGYGYSSEYMPEAWLRDQKLNSIHEGTTGIQSIDLLGRKVSLHEGAAFKLLLREIGRALEDARAAGVDARQIDALARATETTRTLTASLVAERDPEARLLHSVYYLDLFMTVVIGWMWLLQATRAQRALAAKDDAFYRGKLTAAQYYLLSELPRVEQLAALIASGEDSYARTQPDWF